MGCRRCAEHLGQPSFIVRFYSSFPPLSGAPAAFPEKYASLREGVRFLPYSPWVRSWASGSPGGRRPLRCNPSGKVPLSTLHPPPSPLIKCGNPGRRFPSRPSWKAESGGFSGPLSSSPPGAPLRAGMAKSILSFSRQPKRPYSPPAAGEKSPPKSTKPKPNSPAIRPVTLAAQNSKKPLLPQGQKGLK